MSSRFGFVSSTAVEIDCWLTINPGDPKDWNRRPSIRISAGEPTLGRRERAINLKMSLPLALFETPSIVARIDVDAPAEPVRIDTTAIADAVKQVIGMDVDIQVAPVDGGVV